MQYLTLLLVLGAALEYLRRERAHRGVISYVRTHHALMPSRTSRLHSWQVVTRLLVALLVLMLGVTLLLFGPEPSDPVLRALGVALLPVALMLGLTVRQDRTPGRSEKSK